MMPPNLTHSLHQLARLYGVQTAYYDMAQRRQQVSVEALLALLKALGAPLENLQDAPDAVRERRQSLWQPPLEPVTVAWDGQLLSMKLRLPWPLADSRLLAHLALENGSVQRWLWHGADLPVTQARDIEGVKYVVKRLTLPVSLPLGYHHLSLEVAGQPMESLIIAAPSRAFVPPDESGGRTWGILLPLYALYTQKSWGGGDFSDLGALLSWIEELGGGVVGTLPLLPTFLDELYDPSPYSPISRLFWNEFYLDVTQIEEMQECPAAYAILASSSLNAELGELRSLPLVDYRHQMALKRRILQELSRCCFADAYDRLQGLRQFVQANPAVEDYARFRATCERWRTSWRLWPQPLRDGVLSDGDYDEEAKRYHLYVQWLTHQQLEALSQKGFVEGSGLYLDLPLGVHPDGYDVWRNQELFVEGVSVGAPPDTFFTRGQDWGFPPFHPEGLRQQGYQYYIAYLRHHLEYAGILRIDHVMGFHRLFWIPQGMEASQGTYVRYRPEEFYAILTLESHRNKAMIVGEDLGTVPPQVRPAMARYGLHGMYVVQYELSPDPQAALRPVPADVMAGLNTHDMPTFAAFWQGQDIEDRLNMDLLNASDAQAERMHRDNLKQALAAFLQREGWYAEGSFEPGAVLKAILAFLSASSARVVLVNLEDLWLETQPQNVPGTQEPYPNWRRKARYGLEAFSQLPQVVDVLKEMDRIRKQKEYYR